MDLKCFYASTYSPRSLSCMTYAEIVNATVYTVLSKYVPRVLKNMQKGVVTGICIWYLYEILF